MFELTMNIPLMRWKFIGELRSGIALLKGTASAVLKESCVLAALAAEGFV